MRGDDARKVLTQVCCFTNPLRPCLFDKATSPAGPGEDFASRRLTQVGWSTSPLRPPSAATSPAEPREDCAWVSLRGTGGVAGGRPDEGGWRTTNGASLRCGFWQGDRGSATIVVLAVLAALLLAAATIAALAQGQLAAVRAQTAADAAALAAAPATFLGGSPGALAAQYAEANGAVLVACKCAVDTTWRTRRSTVTVRVPIEVFGLGTVTITRSATAEFEPVALLR